MADTDMKIFIGMSRTLNAINRECDTVYRAHGLTHGQFAVLEALFHKGPLTIGQVSDKTLTTAGNLPVIVKNLENRGLVTRTKNADDRRSYILELTDCGRTLISRVYPENERIIKNFMAAWTPDEQRHMVDMLQHFRHIHHL